MKTPAQDLPGNFGIVEWFRPGEHDRVEPVHDIGSIGSERLRTGISWADWFTTWEGEKSLNCCRQLKDTGGTYDASAEQSIHCRHTGCGVRNITDGVSKGGGTVFCCPFVYRFTTKEHFNERTQEEEYQTDRIPTYPDDR